MELYVNVLPYSSESIYQIKLIHSKNWIKLSARVNASNFNQVRSVMQVMSVVSSTDGTVGWLAYFHLCTKKFSRHFLSWKKLSISSYNKDSLPIHLQKTLLHVHVRNKCLHVPQITPIRLAQWLSSDKDGNTFWIF